MTTWLGTRLEVLRDAGDRLVEQGRFVDTGFLLEVGDERCLVRIEHGRVVALTDGPMVMPPWRFAIRAERADWERYWSPVPPPGTHDLFAMLKRRVLRIEGDLHPFMANLLYFKALLALPREAASR